MKPELVKVVSVTPSRIVVQVGARIAHVGGDTVIGKPSAPYFVFASELRAWEPPHETDVLSDAQRNAIVRAIGDHLKEK